MLILAIMVALMFVWAAVSDVRSYRIPNWVSAGIILAYGTRVLLLWTQHVPDSQTNPKADVALAAGVLVIGFMHYAMRWLGAGDIKLATAGFLWAGWGYKLDFLFVMVLVGSVVCLFIVGLRALDGFSTKIPWLIRFIPRVNLVPYGVAISSAGLAILAEQTGLISGIIVHPQLTPWGLFS